MENFHIATRVNGKPHMTLMQIELAVTRNESIDFDIYGYRARYVPERTCTMLEARGLFEWRCSECNEYNALPTIPNFCPNCGAKVVIE